MGRPLSSRAVSSRAWLFVAVLLGLVVTAPRATAGELWTVDGAGKARPSAESRASFQRTPPSVELADPAAPHGDPDALRYLLVADREASLPSTVTVASLDEEGSFLDLLENVPLAALRCPDPISEARSCAVTPPIRAVADEIDRFHPLVEARSLQARLGGGIVVMRDEDVLGRVPVTGPTETSVGTIERLRGKLRFVFVRLSKGGALPLGGDEAGAREVALRAAHQAGALWGACGLSFGGAEDVRVEIADPPPPALLSLGCGHGLPASGGEVRFVAGSKRIEVKTVAGQSPAETARRVARALRRAGLSPSVYDNPPMAAGAGASSDLVVRDAGGRLVALSLGKEPLGDDPTQRICIGQVHLEDGLQHFGDVDASVGTLEERTLLRAVDDGDPTTIDVVLVPGFGRGGRIGESFIGADGGMIRNVVVVDRAGIQGGSAAFTLAHELGHVLLDDPGHPDDYGTDLPSRLMDADAADATAFGPRRISREECARVVRQSGPGAPVPILEPWPLERP